MSDKPELTAAQMAAPASRKEVLAAVDCVSANAAKAIERRAAGLETRLNRMELRSLEQQPVATIGQGGSNDVSAQINRLEMMCTVLEQRLVHVQRTAEQRSAGLEARIERLKSQMERLTGAQRG